MNKKPYLHPLTEFVPLCENDVIRTSDLTALDNDEQNGLPSVGWKS